MKEPKSPKEAHHACLQEFADVINKYSDRIEADDMAINLGTVVISFIRCMSSVPDKHFIAMINDLTTRYMMCKMSPHQEETGADETKKSGVRSGARRKR